jgi:hypothetical protein
LAYDRRRHRVDLDRHWRIGLAFAGNRGDAIPRLLTDAGFDCAEVDTRRHRLIGQLTFYRATRPA